MHFFLAVLVSLRGLVSAAPTPSGGYGGGAPTACVKNGTITGYHQSTYNQDYFLGIPYAQPPVDELRFRVPQSLNSTYDNFEATEYSPTCVGYGVSSYT